MSPYARHQATTAEHSLNIRRYVVPVAICAVFLALRLDFKDLFFQEDDLIPVILSKSMAQRGNLDANWRLAEEMPDYFRYDQYNFYSYNLFCHAVLTLFGAGKPYLTLKLANTALQALSVAMVAAAARAAGLGRPARSAVAAVLSVLPCMVQDAHMVRPESFVYLLLGAVIWAASAWRGAKLCVASGLLIGVAVASKVTCAVFVLVILPQVWLDHRGGRASLRAGLLAFTAALAIGFALGAPYALVHPDIYLHGLQALSEQYNEQFPFSEPTFSLFANAGKITSFLLLLYGPILVLPLLNGVGRAPAFAFGLTLMGLVLIGFFFTRPVFFERNVSAGIMGLSVAACFSVRGRSGRIALSASVCLMAYWATQIDLATVRFGRRLARWEAANVGLVTPEWPSEDLGRRLASCSGTVGIQDYGDGFSRQILRAFEEAGAVPLRRYRSVFHLLPTSTLQVYLDADVQFLRCQ